MSQKITLTAEIVRLNGRKATQTLIKVGPILVASGVLGGNWNEQQVLGELKKNPKRFKLVGNDAKTILNSFGIAI